MQSKTFKTRKSARKAIIKAIENLELVIDSENESNDVISIKKAIGWFDWGNDISIKIETLNTAQFVIKVEALSFIGNITNANENIEKKIINEISQHLEL